VVLRGTTPEVPRRLGPAVSLISRPQPPLPLHSEKCFMSEDRQRVREYVRATAALLKAEALTSAERAAIKEMLHRLTEKLLHDGAS